MQCRSLHRGVGVRGVRFSMSLGNMAHTMQLATLHLMPRAIHRATHRAMQRIRSAASSRAQPTHILLLTTNYLLFPTDQVCRLIARSTASSRRRLPLSLARASRASEAWARAALERAVLAHAAHRCRPARGTALQSLAQGWALWASAQQERHGTACTYYVYIACADAVHSLHMHLYCT